MSSALLWFLRVFISNFSAQGHEPLTIKKTRLSILNGATASSKVSIEFTEYPPEATNFSQKCENKEEQ